GPAPLPSRTRAHGLGTLGPPRRRHPKGVGPNDRTPKAFSPTGSVPGVSSPLRAEGGSDAVSAQSVAITPGGVTQPNLGDPALDPSVELAETSREEIGLRVDHLGRRGLAIAIEITRHAIGLFRRGQPALRGRERADGALVGEVVHRDLLTNGVGERGALRDER